MRIVAAALLATTLCAAITANARSKKTDFWYQVAHPNHADYEDHMKLGDGFLRKREWAAAIIEFKKAVALEAQEPDAAYWLARSYQEAEEYHACARVFARLVEEHAAYQAPTRGPIGIDFPVDFYAAFCFALGGRLEQSVVGYRRLLASGDRRLIYHWNLGDSLHALGRLEEAIGEYEQAVAMNGDGNRAMVRFGLGVALDRDGQTARAWDEMEKGLRHDRSWLLTSSIFDGDVKFLPSEDKFFYAGFALQVKGKRNLAFAYFRSYLSTSPFSKNHVPFHVRARVHLGELGSSAMQLGDVEYGGLPAKKTRARIGRIILSAAPAMQACMEPHRESWATVKIERPAKAGPDGSQPSVTVEEGESGPVSPAALACVRSAAVAIKVPSSLITPGTLVRFALVAL